MSAFQNSTRRPSLPGAVLVALAAALLMTGAAETPAAGASPSFRRGSSTNCLGGSPSCTGAGAGLGGSFSLWAGIPENEAAAASWPGGQGYGNDWNVAAARTFSYPGTGSVTLSFKYHVETEDGFDYAQVEIAASGAGCAASGTVLASYTGTESGTANIVLTPGNQLPTQAGSITILFRVLSDNTFSDEDGLFPTTCGAFAVDDITLSGAISYATTFETNDGGWLCTSSPTCPTTVEFSGYEVSSLGQAEVAVLSPTALEISNVGSSGLDGIAVDLEESLDFGMEWEPIDAPLSAPDGAFLRAVVLGSVNGVADEDVGILTFTKQGSAFQIHSDFSAIGAAGHEVQVYNGSNLVVSTTVPSNVIGTVSNCPISIGTVGDSSEIFTARTDALETYVIGGFPYSGTSIRILATSPTDTVDYRSSFELRLKDLAVGFASPGLASSPTFHSWIVKFLEGLNCPVVEQYVFPNNSQDPIRGNILAQSFTPTVSFRMCSAQLKLRTWFPCTVTLKVQTGPQANSPVVAEFTRQVPFRFFSRQEWITFDVPDVNLIANATYYLRVEGCTSSTVTWLRMNPGPYSRGAAYVNGAATAADYLFIVRGKSFTPTGCAYSITRQLGVAGTQNVGQLVRFGITPAPPGGSTYQWMVDGDVLEDYSERVQNGPWSTDPIDVADFKGPTLQFYWKPDPNQVDPLNGGAVNRKVQVVLTQPDGSTCVLQHTVSVARDNTSNVLQPQDIYVANHGTAVRAEHSTWHCNFDEKCTNPPPRPSDFGDLFLTFHSAFLSRFDSWRKEFGYPPIVPWDPNTPIPTDQEILPGGGVNRGTFFLTPRPTWFTVAGGAATRAVNGIACAAPATEKKLGDFSSRNKLGCALVFPYHDSVHGNVGGSMTSVSSAPRDGIFWRWHLYLEGIHRSYLALQAVRGRGIDIFPHGRFPLRVSSPPFVSVTFSEAMTGVTAGAVRVNGSPATVMTGAGAGPYTFTGYAVAPIGPMTLEILPAGITDSKGLAYEGESSNFEILDPIADPDLDGLTNDQEVTVHLTNPFQSDTDYDGIADNVEIANGTDPLDADSPTSGVGGGHQHMIPPLAELLASPNPFRSQISLQLSIDVPARVRVRIFDIAGRLVADLMDEEARPSQRIIEWDGRASSGTAVPSGIYFVRATIGDNVLTKRIVKSN